MAHKYEHIVNMLEQDFRSGKYINSKKLPTEDELCKEFSVSRNTIRKAIEVLVNRGYIYQVQGSGIFLRDNHRIGCIAVNNMKGLSRDFPNSVVKTVPLEIRVMAANEEIADKLKCKINTSVYFVKRLRFLDNEPFSIEETYFNKELIPYIDAEIAAKSIYQYILNDLQLTIGFADKVINCRELNKEEAKLLNLKEGQPALIIHNTVYLSNGLVFDSSQATFNFKLTRLITPAIYK